MRVLSCLEKVKKKYSSTSEIIEKVPETQMPDIPNLTPQLEGSDKEEKQEVASSIQEHAFDNDGDESQPTSTKPLLRGPQEEEGLEEIEGNVINNSVPEQNAEPVSNNDGDESQSPSTEPATSNEVPKEEESEDKAEGKTVDSSTPAHVSNDDTESNPSSMSIEGPKEEREKEKERETNSAISNSEVRYRGNETKEESS